MTTVDKDAIIANIKSMIHTLEYDSGRSPGKMKLNSQHLHSLYWLLHNVYETPKKGGSK